MLPATSQFQALFPGYSPDSDLLWLQEGLNQPLLRILSAWFSSATVCFWNEIQVFQAPLTDTKFYTDHGLSFETQYLQSREN